MQLLKILKLKIDSKFAHCKFLIPPAPTEGNAKAYRDPFPLGLPPASKSKTLYLTNLRNPILQSLRYLQ